MELSPPEDLVSDSSPHDLNSQLSVDPMLVNTSETMDAILNTAIRAEYNVAVDLVRGGHSDDSSPVSPVRDRQLNELETAKLHELVVANKALLAPLTEDGPVNVSLFHICLFNRFKFKLFDCLHSVLEIKSNLKLSISIEFALLLPFFVNQTASLRFG